MIAHLICLGKELNLYPRRCLMKLYAAFDLHSSNSYLSVIDEGGKRKLEKKLANDAESIVSVLSCCKKKIAAVAVESTYN
jgi:hypothetical protein